MLDADDAGENVAVLDATYASTAELAVGDTIDVGGQEMEVVGIVASASSDADTAANVYIPLDVAQTLSGAGDVVSTVYVQAESSDAIAGVQAALQEELPDATVSSQSDLASTVSGSLSSASSLITNLGTWLSLIVLAVALALAVLFTISGVSRRTREFGTLKAIGWSNRRVVGQVAGESRRAGPHRRRRGTRAGPHRHRADQRHLADDLDRSAGRHRRRPGGGRSRAAAGPSAAPSRRARPRSCCRRR